MAKTPAGKRNPNDATFRNINSLKARVAKLEQRYAELVKYLALPKAGK